MQQTADTPPIKCHHMVQNVTESPAGRLSKPRLPLGRGRRLGMAAVRRPATDKASAAATAHRQGRRWGSCACILHASKNCYVIVLVISSGIRPPSTSFKKFPLSECRDRQVNAEDAKTYVFKQKPKTFPKRHTQIQMVLGT
eukprot:6186252-Pleurochrysis_carterae.AAC.1